MPTETQATPGRPSPQPTRGVRSRVTVVDGDRRVDLSVPTVLPVLEWLVDALAELDQDPAEAPAPVPTFGEHWTLRSSIGHELDLARSLAENGVADGALLHLGRVGVAVPQARVSTVLGEIAATGPGGLEGASRVVSLAAISGVGFLATVLASAAWALLAEPSSVAPLGTSAAIMAVLGVGSAVFAARSRAARQLHHLMSYTALAAVVCAAAAGVLLAAPRGVLSAALAGGVATVLAAGVMWPGGPGTRPVATGSVLLALPVLVGAAVATSTDRGAGAAAAVTLVGCAMLVPLVPRLCATLARLVGSEARSPAAASSGRSADDLAGRVLEARRAMAYSVVGLGVTAVVAAPLALTLLRPDARPWPELLVVLTAVVLANAVRTMTAKVLATALITCTTLLVGAVTVTLVVSSGGDHSRFAPALFGGFGLVTALVSVAAWPVPLALPRAELLRALKIADLLARVALLPVLLGCLGVFSWAIALGSDLGAR